VLDDISEVAVAVVFSVLPIPRGESLTPQLSREELIGSVVTTST